MQAPGSGLQAPGARDNDRAPAWLMRISRLYEPQSPEAQGVPGGRRARRCRVYRHTRSCFLRANASGCSRSCAARPCPRPRTSSREPPAAPAPTTRDSSISRSGRQPKPTIWSTSVTGLGFLSHEAARRMCKMQRRAPPEPAETARIHRTASTVNRLEGPGARSLEPGARDPVLTPVSAYAETESHPESTASP